MNLTRLLVSKMAPLNVAGSHITGNVPRIQTHLFVRHKGTVRTFRQRLPKYKRTLADLPPLTKLLTEPENPNDSGDPQRLGQDKVQVYKEYLPVDANTILLEALFSSGDIDSLLKIIDENLETMTSFYIGVSFEAIDDMLRAKLCDTDTVTVSPEFKRLCTKALYKVRFFEADEVLKLVKCLSSLQISDDTLIVQAALNMARHLINDFNPDELRVITSSYDLLKATKFLAADSNSTKTILVDNNGSEN